MLTVVNNEIVRLEIYVRPGASSTAVGGEYGGALVVRVSAPADGGRATRAALSAVADALKLPKNSVTLVQGTKRRRKVIEIVLDPRDVESLQRAVQELLAG